MTAQVVHFGYWQMVSRGKVNRSFIVLPGNLRLAVTSVMAPGTKFITVSETKYMINNPILIVDDDADDLEIIKEVAADLKLPNKLHFFQSGKELVEHLQTNAESPFLILCDVNLPGEDGFKLRQRIAEHPGTRYKSVPFIFWSTSASQEQIRFAYDLPAQGFFIKALTFGDLKRVMRTIIEYWSLSQHPK